MKKTNILQAYQMVFREILESWERAGKGKPQEKDFPDIDLTISIRLLEQGYSLPDVKQVLLEHSPERKALHDNDRAMDIYIQKTLAQVNKTWDAHSKKTLDAAKTSYRKRAAGLLKKYQDYRSIGLYQDGAIGVALLQKDRFPLATVIKALRQNSLGKGTNAAYFAALSQGLEQVANRYQAIEAASDEPTTDPVALYRLFAKQYMQETKTTVLSGRDDQNIVRRIGAFFFNEIQKNGELSPETRQAIWEKSLEPYIQRGIKEASPVYPEPGRKKDEYLMSLVLELEDQFEQEKAHSATAYAETEHLYLKRRQDIQSRLDAYKAHADTFFDGLIAKELLEAQQTPENIRKVIEKNTLVDEDDKGAYAKSVLEKAERCLHAEKEIINLEPIESYPEGTTYAMLREKGVTMVHLFRQMMQERLASYPSFQLELTEPYADRDAVEKLIHKFPDFNRSALIDAIEDASPRAQLPGCSPEYAESIIKEAEERLRRVEEREKKQLTIQKQYNRLRGLSSEGVYEESTPMDSYKDGRIAVKMLRRGVSKDDIKQYLIALAKATVATATVAAAAVYAQDILNKAQEFLSRERAIRDYPNGEAMTRDAEPVQTVRGPSAPVTDAAMARAEAENMTGRAIDAENRARSLAETARAREIAAENQVAIEEEKAREKEAEQEKTPSCSALYLEKMHERYQEKGFVQAGMDIAIMKDMMLTSKYTPEQIQEVIKDRSPVAIEPGRDEGYVDYVRTMAEQEIEREREKLKHYVVVPQYSDHPRDDASCNAEYGYLRKEMDAAISLPHDLLMDAMIAKALLDDHYDKSVVLDTLDKYAPSGWTEENPTIPYGDHVLSYMTNSLTQVLDYAQENTEELVRKITTTTTVTTTTTKTD